MKHLGDTDIKRLNREWRRRTEGRVAILLDDVMTPFNVGAMVRTAAADTGFPSEADTRVTASRATSTTAQTTTRTADIGRRRGEEWIEKKGRGGVRACGREQATKGRD